MDTITTWYTRGMAQGTVARLGVMPRWLPVDADRWRLGAPGRPAGRDVTDRGRGQFPGQPAPGQVAADALVPARRRPAAPSPLRRLQRHAGHRLRAALPSRQRSASASSHRGMTPNLATVPTAERHSGANGTRVVNR